MASRTLALILKGDSKQLSRTMRRASGDVDDFGQKVNRIAGAAGKALGGLALAGAAAATALVVDLVRAGDQFDKMSKRTGVSVENLQRFKFAAEQSGSSIEVVEKGLKRSAKFLADADRGLATYTRQLDELGLSVADFEGLAPDAAFEKFADAISGVEDPMKRAALAQEVFGRAGVELLPLMENGAAGIRELGDQMEATGNIISAEAAASAAEFNDKLNELKQVGLGAARDGLVKLLPVLTKVATWVGDDLIPAVRSLAENWRKFMPVLAGVGAALGTLIALKVALWLKGIVVAVKSLNVAMLTGPGAIIVGIGLLVAALVLAYQKSETFRDVVHAVFRFVKQVVALAIKAILGYIDLWLGGLEKIASAVSWLADKIGIDMSSVTGAIGAARDFIAAAGDRIVDSLTDTGDAAESAAVVFERTSQRVSRAARGHADVVSDAAERVVDITRWSADEQRTAIESHYQGMDRLHNSHVLAQLQRRQNLHDAVFRVDADAARRQYIFARDGLSSAQRFLYDWRQANVEAHTAVAESASASASASTSKVLSESDRLALGLVVTMADACGSVTGFKQCVDGMVVEFDADMNRVLSDAEQMASGVAVPMADACGTITGFKQCVDGMVVEFDADMNRVLSDAEQMASGVAVPIINACGSVTGFKQCVNGVAVEFDADMNLIVDSANKMAAGVAAAAGAAGGSLAESLAQNRADVAFYNAATYQRQLAERGELTPAKQDEINRAFEEAGPVFTSGGEELVPMARGGIVTRPTRILAGEAGSEAIVPLRGSGLGGITIENLNVGGSVLTTSGELIEELIEGLELAAERGEFRLGG